MTLPLKFWFFEPLGHLPRKARNPRTWLSTFLPPVYCVTLSLNAAQYTIATRWNNIQGQIPAEEAFGNPGIKSLYLASPPTTRRLCVHTANPSLEIGWPQSGIYCIDLILFPS